MFQNLDRIAAGGADEKELIQKKLESRKKDKCKYCQQEVAAPRGTTNILI